jgi:hypothetical protein
MTRFFAEALAGARGRTPVACVVAVAVLVASAIGGSAAQANGGARYDFRSFPRVGTPTTTFRVVFSAPFAADGEDTDYFLEGVGPRRCPGLFEVTSGSVRRGDRVVLRLTPSDDIFIPAGGRDRWCRGAYVGLVYYSNLLGSDRYIGSFSFGVGRSPVSLEPATSAPRKATCQPRCP